jgi:hypothetical protein
MLVGVAAAGTKALDVTVFLADLVGGISACLDIVLLEEDFDAKVAEERFRL